MRVRKTKQDADRGPPGPRQKTEESASAQRPRPPSLQTCQVPIPTRKPPSQSTLPSDTCRVSGRVTKIGPAPAAFSLNQNNALCLPLVSKSEKLLWVHSNQIIQELDGVAELDEAFDAFPYPTRQETAEIAQHCALHPDQVRVWFMVQRLRYGISWDCVDISEVRKKLCSSGQIQGGEGQHERREDGREEKNRELKGYGEERAEEALEGERTKEKREEKWKEGGMSMEKAGLGERGDTGWKSEGGGKRDEKERKAEAVKDKRSSKRKRERMTVKEKMRKKVKMEKKEVEEEERGEVEQMKIKVGRKKREMTEKQTPPPNGNNQKATENKWLTVRRRTQRDQSRQMLKVPHKRKSPCQVEVGAPKKGRPISQSPSSSHNAPGSKASCPHRLQGTQSALSKNLPQMLLREKSMRSKMEVPVLQRHSQAPDLTPLPHNQTLILTKGLTSASNLGVIPLITYFEGKMEQEPKPESELRAEAANPKAFNLKKSPAQLELLKRTFLSCQFPNSDEYDLLEAQTGLVRNRLVQWFGDTRYHVKTGRPRWLNGEEYIRVLSRIRHWQRLKALARHQASRNDGNQTWEVKLERSEMFIDDERAPLPPE